MPGQGLEFYKPMTSPREGEFSSSLRKVVNQAMLVFDVASGKIRLILNHLAALFRESGSASLTLFTVTSKTGPIAGPRSIKKLMFFP